MEGASVPAPRRVLQLRSRESGILHGDCAGAVARYSGTDLAARRRHAEEPAPPVFRAPASPPGSGALTTPIGAAAITLGASEPAAGWSYPKGTTAERQQIVMIREAADSGSHKPTCHWSWCKARLGAWFQVSCSCHW